MTILFFVIFFKLSLYTTSTYVFIGFVIFFLKTFSESKPSFEDY